VTTLSGLVVNVTFDPIVGHGLAIGSVGLVSLSQTGATTVFSNGAALISGTTWAFSFGTVTGFHPGDVTVKLGAWDTNPQTTVGVVTLGAVPASGTVVLVNPVADAVIGAPGSTLTVDVDLIPSDDGATAAAPAASIQQGSGAAITGTSAAISGGQGHRVRYTFAATTLTPGDVTVTIGSVTATITIASPAPGTVPSGLGSAPAAEIVSPAAGYLPYAAVTVLVDFKLPGDMTGLTFAPTSSVTLGGLTATSASEVSLTGTTHRWQFVFTDATTLSRGAVTLQVAATWINTTTAPAALSATYSFRAYDTAQAAVISPADNSLGNLSGFQVVVDFFALEGQTLSTITAGTVDLEQLGVTATAATGVTNVDNRYTFTFGSLAAFHPGAATVQVNGWSTSADFTFRAVTAPSTTLVSPVAVGPENLSTLTVRVSFDPTEGATVGAISDTLLTLNGTIHSTHVLAVGAGLYDFTFGSLALTSGTVTVGLGSWSDSGGAAAAADSNIGTFSISQPATALVTPAGGTVGRGDLDGLVVDVAYNPVPGATVTTPATLTLRQLALSVSASGTRIGTTNVFRYTFGAPAAFLDGSVTLSLGSWTDSGGHSASTSTLATFTLTTPTAALAALPAAGVVGTGELSALALSATFTPVDGRTVGTITAGLLKLHQGSTDYAASVVSHVGNTYTFSGFAAGVGLGTATIQLGSWLDGAGNTAAAAQLGSFTVQQPQARIERPLTGSALGTAEQLEVLVTFTPVDGRAMSTPAANLVHAGSARSTAVTLVSGTTYRFTFGAATFAPGSVAISLDPWSDGSASTGTQPTASVTVAQPTQTASAPYLSGGHTYIDVTYVPVAGRSVGSVSSFTLTGPAGLASLGSPTLLSGTVYRYEVLGGISVGTYTRPPGR